ncbi:MAG: alpha/beta hydrolase, partial [Myxococcota bacterium]
MRPLFMALLAVQLGCSRRPDDVSLDAVTVPSEISQLSDWVAERERAFDDIIPGAERHIILRQEARTPLSIVYIHGFSASRPEISPVCERVSEALNANLYFTRLQGHGRSSLDAMADATVEGWLTDMAEAF